MHVDNHGETVDSDQQPPKMNQISDVAENVAKTSMLDFVLLVILFVQLHKIFKTFGLGLVGEYDILRFKFLLCDLARESLRLFLLDGEVIVKHDSHVKCVISYIAHKNALVKRACTRKVERLLFLHHFQHLCIGVSWHELLLTTILLIHCLRNLLRLLNREAVESLYDALFLAPLVSNDFDETEKHGAVVC